MSPLNKKYMEYMKRAGSDLSALKKELEALWSHEYKASEAALEKERKDEEEKVSGDIDSLVKELKREDAEAKAESRRWNEGECLWGVE